MKRLSRETLTLKSEVQILVAENLFDLTALCFEGALFLRRCSLLNSLESCFRGVTTLQTSENLEWLVPDKSAVLHIRSFNVGQAQCWSSCHHFLIRGTLDLRLYARLVFNEVCAMNSTLTGWLADGCIDGRTMSASLSSLRRHRGA